MEPISESRLVLHHVTRHGAREAFKRLTLPSTPTASSTASMLQLSIFPWNLITSELPANLVSVQHSKFASKWPSTRVWHGSKNGFSGQECFEEQPCFHASKLYCKDISPLNTSYDNKLRPFIVHATSDFPARHQTMSKCGSYISQMISQEGTRCPIKSMCTP
jgi:hypothetical protein